MHVTDTISKKLAKMQLNKVQRKFLQQHVVKWRWTLHSLVGMGPTATRYAVRYVVTGFPWTWWPEGLPGGGWTTLVVQSASWMRQ